MTANVDKLQDEEDPAEVDQVGPGTAEPRWYQRVLEHVEGRRGSDVVMQVEHQQRSPDIGRQDGGSNTSQGGFANHVPPAIGADQADDEERNQGGHEEERTQQVDLNNDGHQRHQRQPVHGALTVLEHRQSAHQHVGSQHRTPGIHVLGEFPAGEPTDVHEDQTD